MSICTSLIDQLKKANKIGSNKLDSSIVHFPHNNYSPEA